MRTAHLLAVAGPVLAVLAFARATPVLSAALCLVALLVTGELWLRALIREPLAPAARIGLAVAAGLISLPLVALVLHVLGVRIEGRWLAAGLAVLSAGLGGVAARRSATPAGSPQAGSSQAGSSQAGSSQAGSSQAGPPHPGHWVGSAEQVGTTVSSRLSTVWLRGPARTAVAVAVPGVLAILIGGGATLAYQRLPHPAEPGYTSLALAGWAAGIAHPVDFPAGGLEVPLEISSAGERPTVADLLVRVGDRLAGPGMPVSVADGTRSIRVHVPAPPDGCLHTIQISLGPASTVFYGRGPVQGHGTPGHARPGQGGPGQGGPGQGGPGQGGPGQGGPGQGGPGRGEPGHGSPGRGGTGPDGTGPDGTGPGGTGPETC